MSSVYQTVIAIISKPVEERDDAEIDSIVVWFTNLFRKKSTVFGDVSQEVIRDIIKNCSFETKSYDDLIIRQGDKGDCFYINLRGKVSIYINHKQHDVFDDDHNDVNASISSDGNEGNSSRSLRDKLGNYVTSLNAGEGFGEIALVSDEDRTASIIADETTDLMVVNKALYRRCLQAPQLRKLAEKQNFINQSPFFGNWSQKMKKLLSLCLEREIVRYDSCLGKQGEPLDKIYFIIKGQAKVTVDPTMHITQYPRFYPLKLPENEGQEIISTWIEEKNRNLGMISISTKPESQNRRNSQAIVRRTFTFAEAEQRRKIKNIEVGILGPGEISGLCEVIMEMPTYKQSTKCMEDCDVFYIYKRSYDRLIIKRNPSSVNKMKEYVYFKLQARNARLSLTQSVSFYRSLEYRLHLLIHGRKKSLNGLYASTTITSVASSNGLKLPPRGPIIQMDSRPKPKKTKRMALFNLSAAQTLTALGLPKEKPSGTDTDDSQINSARSDGDSNHSTSEHQSQQQLQQPQQQQDYEKTTIEKIDKNKKNFEKLFDLEYSNDQALNDLEVRIKQWHLENGCKNPLLEAFHRVDVEKLKYNVKSGGKILMKPKIKNTESIVRLTRKQRGSGSSGFSSGSGDTNDSDDDGLDIGHEYIKLSHPPKFANPSINEPSPYNNNSSYNEVLVDEGFYGQDHDQQSHQQHQQQRHSIHTSTVPSSDRIRRNTLHFESLINNDTSLNEILNSSKNYAKRKSLPSKLLINDQNLQDIFNNAANDNEIVINKKLSSAVNLNHRYSIFNSQYTPYLFRKLSMSQVKIHSSNRKKYSKEEYLQLKGELKRQTRRYSVTSAHV